MGQLRFILKKCGVNYLETMPRFLNDEKLYMKCFELYMRDENLENLKSALERGDLQAAFVCAHTLKGVVGNMGFSTLYEAICAIVEPLRAQKTDEDYQTLFAAVAAEAKKIEALKAEADRAE